MLVWMSACSAGDGISLSLRTGLNSTSNIFSDSSEVGATSIENSLVVSCYPAASLEISGGVALTSFAGRGSLDFRVVDGSLWYLPKCTGRQTKFSVGFTVSQRKHSRSQGEYQRIESGLAAGLVRTLSPTASARLSLVAKTRRFPDSRYANQEMVQLVSGLNLTTGSKSSLDISADAGGVSHKAIDPLKNPVNPLDPILSLTSQSAAVLGGCVRWSCQVAARTGLTLELSGRGLIYNGFQAILDEYSGYLSPWDWEIHRVDFIASTKSFLGRRIIMTSRVDVARQWHQWVYVSSDEHPVAYAMRQEYVFRILLQLETPFRFRGISGKFSLTPQFTRNDADWTRYDFKEISLVSSASLAF